MEYGELLRLGKAQAIVWGTGYIGYSTMAYLAALGVTCIGVDVDASRVAMVNAG